MSVLDDEARAALLVHANGMDPPIDNLAEFVADALTAIELVVVGRPNAIVWYDDGRPAIRAFQFVGSFALEPWVEDALCRQST